MIVAVETNFLLELALQQAESESAEAILQMAEAGEIQLAIPAIAFVEACSRLAAQKRKRNSLTQDLITEIRQLARSRPYLPLEEAASGVIDALMSSAVAHAGELGKVADRVRNCGTVISLTGDMTRELSMLNLLVDLQCGDAFICASVHRFFRQKAHADEQKLFVTRDKDFEKRAEFLAAVGCELVLGFGAAIGAMKVT